MDRTSSFFPLFVMIPFSILVILMIIAACKIYAKAKYPAWAAIVPFYGLFILLKIVGRPAWWMLLYFIPIVNIVVTAIVAVDLAKSFGKSTAFGILGLFLFPYVGYPILGFGKVVYKGPALRNANTPVQPETPQPVVPAQPVPAVTTTPANTPPQTSPPAQVK